MKKHLEYKDEKSAKFWEIELEVCPLQQPTEK